MQYEAIILELKARIKVLEEEVAAIKNQLYAENPEREQTGAGEEAAEEDCPGSPQRGAGYTKMTDEMIEECYRQGKATAGQSGVNLWTCAEEVRRRTGMNQNSAFMYIYVVRCMLTGQVFKRAISAAALRKYLETIWSEFGEAGLAKALRAVRQHVEYRRELGHMVGSVSAICDDWEKRVK